MEKVLVLDWNNQLSLSQNLIQEEKQEKQMVHVALIMTALNLVPMAMDILLAGRGFCVWATMVATVLNNNSFYLEKEVITLIELT